MHDAHEAFVGDMPSPLKAMLPEYKKIEDRVERSLRNKFGLPAELDPAIKAADLVMLATERRDLMPPPDVGNICWGVLEGVEPDSRPIPPWGIEQARAQFLSMYYYFSGGGSDSKCDCDHCRLVRGGN